MVIGDDCSVNVDDVVEVSGTDVGNVDDVFCWWVCVFFFVVCVCVCVFFFFFFFLFFIDADCRNVDDMYGVVIFIFMLAFTMVA